MLPKQLLFALCLLGLFFAMHVDGFWGGRRRRRRRRRFVQQPPQDCVVSSWSSWSSCTVYCSTGTVIRRRTISQAAQWGGDCSFSLSETKSCGSSNGGCQHFCSGQGQCSCKSGYTPSGKKCYDINECAPNGGRGPCSDICRNTGGSFNCQCLTGFYMQPNQRDCAAHDCGNPSHLFNSCPFNSYKDHISTVCAQVSASCSQGTNYGDACSLTCPQNFSLAVILPQQHKQFGEEYSTIDFSSVRLTITCQKKTLWQPNVWDVSDSELGHYFCRRTNDPPRELDLSAAILIEHAPVGTFIGVLSSIDAQQGQSFTYTVEQSNMLLGTQGGNLINMWDNPRLNGNVSLVNGSLPVTIRSTDDGVPALWLEKTFYVTLIDVNDPPDNIQLSNAIIYENTTVGTVVGYLRAVDGDDPPGTKPHSNFNWNLVGSGNGKFVLVGNAIKVADSLLGEAQNIHRIMVNCSDFGVPPPVMSTVTNFVIDVRDVNEVPVSLTLSRGIVSELATVGTVAGQLIVTEKDGDNVSFDISQSDKVTLEKFKLSKAGCQGHGQAYDCKVDLVVRSQLDYETKSWFRVNAEANDTQGHITKQFSIEIINENEAPTAINLTGSHSVIENAAAGMTVGQLVVTDPDNANFPGFQRHACYFNTSYPGDERYLIINSGLDLQVKGGDPIDYERIRSLTFEVVCKDSGHPSLSISSMFVITVTDVDEAPQNLKLSSATVNENLPKGTSVSTLSSDDPDGPGDVHTYSIVGPAETPFVLGGSNNQTLIVSGLLDHELNPNLFVTIRATDTAGLFIEKTFHITVNDVNDPPTNLILSTPFMKEDSPENVLISPIILTDQDGDMPACHLINNAAGRVEVVGTNLVAGPTVTDFEALPSSKQLSIVLNCSDQQGMSIEKSLVIKVLDVNEPPSQISLSSTIVDENAVAVSIGRVTVSDPDIGQVHQCEVYDLIVDSASSTESLLPSSFFLVDSSFNLTTYKALDFEAAHTVDIAINCSDVVDDSHKSLFKTALFTITVKDINEQPSGLCKDPIVMDVRTSPGSVIAILQGIDPDNENAIHRDSSNHSVIVRQKQQLTYFLSPAQNSWPFKLDQSNLFTSRAITTPENYTIGVKVKDDGLIVGKFSSSGYQFISVQPLSAVFNCTIIVSEQANVVGTIRLQPSQISATALNGSSVGELSTITQYPQETFTYELYHEDKIPFIIVRNKLVVVWKDIKDFRISSSEEALIPIAITSKGTISKSYTRSFYVRILGDGLPAVNMCLVPNSLQANQPPNSVVGQLIIDDSSSPLLSCAKEHCCSKAGKELKYLCTVDDPEDNEIASKSPSNVSALIRWDDGLLRTKVALSYIDFIASNGTLDVHISCRSTTYPLLFFGQVIQVHLLDCGSNQLCPISNQCGQCRHGGTCQDVIDGFTCQCKSGFTGVHCEINIDDCHENPCLHGGFCNDGVDTFTCDCVDGFTGAVCERKESLCVECQDDALCVTFFQSPIRCLHKEYFIPVLVDEIQITLDRAKELEDEIASLLDVDRVTQIKDSRKRREASKFYVEILSKHTMSSQTLLVLAALDSDLQYQPVPATQACARLEGTSRQCVEDCSVLEVLDFPCASEVAESNQDLAGADSGKATGLGTGGVSGVVAAAVFIIVAILVGVALYYRRKYEAAKNQSGVHYQAEGDHVDFSNPVYGNNRRAAGIPPSATVEWQERLKKDTDPFARQNLDLTSVVKRNDNKVSENVLYETPHSDLESPENSAASCTKTKSVNVPDEDDVKATKARDKPEHEYMEPDQARNRPIAEGSLNPYYMVSSKTDRSRGKSLVTPEQDLENYLNSARVKARASTNAAAQNNFRRQKSDDPNRKGDRVPLRRNGAPPSFENPIFDRSLLSDHRNTSEDTTYSTIPGRRGNNAARGRLYDDVLPPRPPPRSAAYGSPPEPVEVDEDDTYARLNFGDTQA